MSQMMAYLHLNVWWYFGNMNYKVLFNLNSFYHGFRNNHIGIITLIHFSYKRSCLNCCKLIEYHSCLLVNVLLSIYNNLKCIFKTSCQRKTNIHNRHKTSFQENLRLNGFFRVCYYENRTNTIYF